MEKLKELLQEIYITRADESAFNNEIFKDKLYKGLYLELLLGYNLNGGLWIKAVSLQNEDGKVEIELTDTEILNLINIEQWT